MTNWQCLYAQKLILFFNKIHGIEDNEKDYLLYRGALAIFIYL